MNGISSTLKDEIKKSKDSKYKEKFKFVACVLVTNIMVAVLCLPMGETKTETKKAMRTLHTAHQMMSIPLTVLVTNLDAPEIAVSLVSGEHKVIVEKAWLHEKNDAPGEIPQFKIEIKDSDVVRVSEFITNGMVAVPYVEKTKTKVSAKRGSKYEVSI